MQLAAFVLTYRRPQMLASHIEALLAQSRPPDHILVVDNADDPATRGVVADFAGRPIEYEATGENLGSAGGTWYGSDRLAARGFDLVMSCDDDNPPRTADTIEVLLHTLTATGADGVGTVGARFDWSKGKVRRFADDELAGALDVDFVGGDHKLILRREALLDNGMPDPRLFFGYPDLEHCLRLRARGRRLVVDGDLMLRYREMVGKLAHRPRRSAVPRRTINASWRNYYTTRNYIHMMRREFSRPDLARAEAVRAATRAAAAWTRGWRFGAAHSRNFLRGIVDGYRDVRGRVVSPQTKDGTS